MPDLNISDQLAVRLQSLAEREHESVEALLETLLDQYAAQEPLAASPLLIMLEMAEAAALPFTDDAVVERSREILSTEYADHLLKRMQGDDASR